MLFRRTKLVLMMLLAISLLSRSVLAGEKGELRYNWKMDFAVIGIAGAGYIITAVGEDQFLPANCRWCSVNSFDQWGRDNLKWSNTGAANKAVYLTGYALAPMAAFGLDALAANHDGRLSEFWPDALIIVEATALSSFTTQLVKMAVGRQRPNAHFGGGSRKPGDNDSFYSGHTSLAFSLAAASGTVATMRGYRFAPLIWGTGMAIAATTAYLSIASDRHYLTDVIAGAVLGSAFGVGIPYLFHHPRDDAHHTSFSAAPVEGGGLFTVSGVW
jgi:membrane-associated phospholipid phosphatase